MGCVGPVGAERTASGYDVAWKMGGADQYQVWSTTSSGNYNSHLLGVVSGTSSALESFEPVFHQDLNGDGTIGAPTSAMHINLIADASVVNAPSGWAAAIQTAANLL